MTNSELHSDLRLRVPAERAKRKNGSANRLDVADQAAHNWYRFVLSYPPHLVREYLHKFGVGTDQVCLDPFCGTGTTPVECKKLGITSVGVEAHPLSYLAAKVKTSWQLDPELLISHAKRMTELALVDLHKSGVEDEIGNDTAKINVLMGLAPDAEPLLLANSISPLPLHKVLTLLRRLRETSACEFHHHDLIALANALVSEIGNLHFGPEVGIGKIKDDTAVIRPWLRNVQKMSDDLNLLEASRLTKSSIIKADSRNINSVLEPNSIDCVITSPPYPNEKDYTRTTRLESVVLGLINNKAELRAVKGDLVRSNTRGVYKSDGDDFWVRSNSKIIRIAEEIEQRRIEMNKTSGFEKMYARVTKLYFGGMARHFHDLKRVLKPGAKLAYVVGDQASYLRVMIRTGSLLAEIAESQGYKVLGIDLFRTRLSTVTGEQLREEAVLLEWPG